MQPWGSPCLPCRRRGLPGWVLTPAVCLLQLRCNRAGFTQRLAELSGPSTTAGQWFGKPGRDLRLLTTFSFFQAMQQDLQRERQLRLDVLRPRLQPLHGQSGGAMPLQVPLVLLRDL